MGLFSRRRRSAPGTVPGSAPAAVPEREARAATLAYLRDFVQTRVGVEAYVEPRTNVTQTTIMLVATDGEWTRRKVPDERTAGALARELGIPVYDVQRTGYPQRVRDWNTRQRVERRRRAAERG